MRKLLSTPAPSSRTGRGLSHLLAGTARAVLGYVAIVAIEPHAAQAAVAEAWVHRFDGPINDNDTAQAVALDRNGNVVVTGYSRGYGYDYYTAKYAANDGRFLWSKRYNGLADGNDFALALAVDGAGNVVVTGKSHGGVGGPDDDDYYTAKYAAADGALLWDKRYNGPTNRYDRANAVAIDRNGDVVVTGESQGDYYTVRYGAADGRTLWFKRYNGPGNRADVGQAVAIDNNGDVVVTGSSDAGALNGGNDFYTAKYAAVDGALLWEKRYNGPANGGDEAAAVAVDGSGNVVVTGNSASEIRSDYYTAKYSAVDGALLWEKRYNGPRNGEDIVSGAHSLAVSADGIVAVTGGSHGEPGSFGIISYDYATIVYAEHLPPLAIAFAPAGIGIRFPAVADHRYQLLRAPALAGPWSTNATLTAITNGIIEYIDTTPRTEANFYRTTAAP